MLRKIALGELDLWVEGDADIGLRLTPYPRTRTVTFLKRFSICNISILNAVTHKQAFWRDIGQFGLGTWDV